MKQFLFLISLVVPSICICSAYLKSISAIHSKTCRLHQNSYDTTILSQDAYIAPTISSGAVFEAQIQYPQLIVSIGILGSYFILRSRLNEAQLLRNKIREKAIILKELQINQLEDGNVNNNEIQMQEDVKNDMALLIDREQDLRTLFIKELRFRVADPLVDPDDEKKIMNNNNPLSETEISSSSSSSSSSQNSFIELIRVSVGLAVVLALFSLLLQLLQDPVTSLN